MAAATLAVETTVVTEAVATVLLTPEINRGRLRVEDSSSALVEYFPITRTGFDRFITWSDRTTAFVNLPHALESAGYARIVSREIDAVGPPATTYVLELLNPRMIDGWGSLGAVRVPRTMSGRAQARKEAS